MNITTTTEDIQTSWIWGGLLVIFVSSVGLALYWLSSIRHANDTTRGIFVQLVEPPKEGEDATKPTFTIDFDEEVQFIADSIKEEEEEKVPATSSENSVLVVSASSV